jgi:hypothetical protein
LHSLRLQHVKLALRLEGGRLRVQQVGLHDLAGALGFACFFEDFGSAVGSRE